MMNLETFVRGCPILLKDKTMTKFRTVISSEQLSVLQTLQAHERVAIVKSRQIGMTTLLRAWACYLALSKPNTVCVLVSNKEKSVKEILKIDSRIIKEFEDITRQKLVVSNTQLEIVLTNGSRIVGYSGRAKDDRGYTPSHIHFSEAAFIDDGLNVLSSWLSSVPVGGRVVLESTPCGYGDPMHRIVTEGSQAWEVLFFPWVSFNQYRKVAPPDFVMTEEERRLATDYNLHVDQIAWRCHAIAERNGDTLKFAREFPLTMEEAYQLAEGNFIDAETLATLVAGKYDKRSVKPSLEWLVKEAHAVDLHTQDRYCIGFDPAGGGGGDYSVALVLDRLTMDVVEVLSSNRIGLTDFTEQVGLAAQRLKASVLFERNHNGDAVALVLNRFGVPTGSFHTSAASKVKLMEILKAKLYRRQVGCIDTDTIAELRTLANQANKAPSASQNNHDDRVIALALALRQHENLPPVVKAMPTAKYVIRSVQDVNTQ